jgi:glycosyltransferase involved in cell wall biosynthesis
MRVLIVTNWIPRQPGVLADTVQQLHSRGVAVTIACGCAPENIAVPESAALMIGLRPAKTLPAADRIEYRDADKSRKLWLRGRRDSALLRAARSADVLVALDPNSVQTVQQLARRYRAADAVEGLRPALAAAAGRDATPLRYAVRRVVGRLPSPAVAADTVRDRFDRLSDEVARRGSGRRVLRRARGRRAWRLILSAPGISDYKRIAWADRVAARLLKEGLAAEADAVRAAAARGVRQPVAKAEWLTASAMAGLEAGRIPGVLKEAAAAQLDVADEALARGDLTKANRSVARILPLMFNRAVHFDSLESPAAADPAGFFEPLHRSAVGRALAVPRGRSAPATLPPDDRAHRLLFLVSGNAHFLTDIQARYEQHPDFEVRTLDILADVEREPLARQVGMLIRHLLAGSSDYAGTIQEWFTPHLEWADTVFADWCLVHAGMLTTLDPGSTRIIVRLHSFEAFTVYPHLVDFSRVDDLVFVSEPLREFTRDAVPRLRQPGAPRTPVITNAVRLDRYRRPKTPDARFTLGLIGVHAIAKDPRWAFQVLRELRHRDERYRLVLIGKEIDGSENATAAAYHRLYARDVAALEAQGAVRRIGQIDDVPGALTEIGVILSTSVRESFHLGLVEGAASGAVPVVRDWPFFAGRKASARSIFPDHWIVRTPEEAAARVLALTSSEETWRKAGAAAADHAMAKWDWSVIQASYDRLLLRS